MSNIYSPVAATIEMEGSANLLSPIELLDLLEEGNFRKMKPEALETLLGASTAGSSGSFDLLGKCFQINSDIYAEIKRTLGTGAAVVLAGTSDYIAKTKKNPNYNNFVACLALLLQLQVDEAEAFFLNDYVSYHIYHFNTSNININSFGSTNGSSNNYKSVELLEDVRDYYFKQHQFCWKILQELLRIESDPDHVYYAAAVQILANVFNKFDIVAFLVRHLKFHYKHSVGALEHKKFSMFDNLDDFHAFLFKNNRHWATFIEVEIENLLDVLISIVYNNKCTISCEVFIDVLNVAKSFNFSGPSSSSRSPVNETISFKYILFFSVCFDFLLSNTLKRQGKGGFHVFFSSCKDSSTQISAHIESISAIIYGIVDSPSRSILMLLWSLFVDFIKKASLVPLDVVRQLGNRDEQLKQQAADCSGLLHFVDAVRRALGASGYAGFDAVFVASSGSNGNGSVGVGDVATLQYCDILQDVLGAIVSLLCNENKDFDGVDGDVLLHVCVLFQHIFRQSSYLCDDIWQHWNDVNGKRHCFVRLILFLRDNQPHEPLFLLLMLNALVDGAESAKMALDLVLGATVHKCSWVDVDLLELPPEHSRALSVGSPVRYRAAAGGSASSTLAPTAGAGGVVCSVDSRERTCLVRWTQDTCDWWDVLIDALVGGSTPRAAQLQRLVGSANASADDGKNINLSSVNVAIVAMNLMTTLLTKNRLVTMILFERRLGLLQLETVLAVGINN